MSRRRKKPADVVAARRLRAYERLSRETGQTVEQVQDGIREAITAGLLVETPDGGWQATFPEDHR